MSGFRWCGVFGVRVSGVDGVQGAFGGCGRVLWGVRVGRRGGLEKRVFFCLEVNLSMV